jgi:glycosyltransferase involved in cell wall biosynthesis
MHLGMPVVAVGTTEVPFAVPPGAGVVTTCRAELVAAAQRFLSDPQAAAEAGRIGRGHVLERYGLKRFLADWDDVLEDVVS